MNTSTVINGRNICGAGGGGLLRNGIAFQRESFQSRRCQQAGSLLHTSLAVNHVTAGESVMHSVRQQYTSHEKDSVAHAWNSN